MSFCRLLPAYPGLIAAALLTSGPAIAQQQDLWKAIAEGHPDVIREYLRSGGDPDAVVNGPDGSKSPLLRIAMYGRKEEIALVLLDAGADFERSGTTFPLLARQGMARALRAAISQNPTAFERSIRSDAGMLLEPAATNGYAEVLQVLLTEAQQREFSWDDDVLSSALAGAVSVRQNDLARILLRAGAAPTGLVIRVATRDNSPEW